MLSGPSPRWSGPRPWGAAYRARFMWPAFITVLGMACACRAEDSPLRITLVAADHPSGLYLATDEAKFTCLVENLADRDVPLAGQVAFGPVPGSGGGKQPFKPVATVPIAATTLGAGRTVKLEVPVSFAGTGAYELRWQGAGDGGGGGADVTIVHPEGLELTAIFAPRGGGGGGEIPGNPWLIELPRTAAHVPGFIADFAARTSIHRFLIEESFLFDPETRRTPAMGASLEVSGEQLAAFFTDLARARCELVLRVSVPVLDTPDAKSLAAFHQYIADAVTRSGKTLKAVAITPDIAPTAALTDDQISAYRAYYMAAYEAARKNDKSVLFLGTSDALLTHKLLLTVSPKHIDLRPYVDALAVSDSTQQLALARKLVANTRTPLWVLPPRIANPLAPASSPAVALAEGAAVTCVPAMAADRGVTAHLFGGAVFFQNVHPEIPPYMCAFQGDGFAVAAIAGFHAATPLDGAFPALAAAAQTVAPLKGETKRDAKQDYPCLEVSDDAQAMRVVDTAGSPVDCRVGDTLYVPATDRVVYLLQAGNAEDLVALLRTAVTDRLPMFEVPAPVAGMDGEKRPTLTLRLRNVTAAELSGALRVLATIDRQEVELVKRDFVPIGSTQWLELSETLARDLPANTALTIEVTANHAVQRTTFPAPGVPAGQ